jgi:hypothetical protein
VAARRLPEGSGRTPSAARLPFDMSRAASASVARIRCIRHPATGPVREALGAVIDYASEVAATVRRRDPERIP